VGGRISAETAAAVAEFFRAESRGLFGFACTLPNVGRFSAEDLVQMTFQVAAVEWEQTLCRLDQETRRRWLYGVLRNKAIDQWRTVGSRWVLTELAENRPVPLQGTYHRALSSIVARRCWARIAKMPEVRQRVACLRWGEEWSSGEIAELLGISQSTVRAHLKAARDELAAEIGPEVPIADSGDDTDGGVAW
jgi:RNA polymerase sigma factor (sigma-70 family)